MARLHRVLATLTLLVAASALTASPALARKHDHDKLPDRWERKNHLNLQRNDAGRDRDHDGLSNLREYRAHTNPRKRDSDRDGLNDRAELRYHFNPRVKDSDHDGIKDGKENAGRITRLSGSSITIKLAAGGKLTATLSDGVSGACKPTGDDPPQADPPAGDDPAAGDDDPAGDDESSDTPDDPADDSSDDGLATAAQDDPADGLDQSDADFDQQFNADFAAGDQCGDAPGLKRGRLVHEAAVDRSGPSPVITALKLVRA